MYEEGGRETIESRANQANQAKAIWANQANQAKGANMIEAGRIYKVNRASLVKVLSVTGGIASVLSWPIREGREIYVQDLTCGESSGNDFVLMPGGTWDK